VKNNFGPSSPSYVSYIGRFDPNNDLHAIRTVRYLTGFLCKLNVTDDVFGLYDARILCERHHPNFRNNKSL
jgi:hypothetical protein